MFDDEGRLTGWHVGVARVTVTRDGTGRIIGLHEQVTGRSLAVLWAGGLVESLTTDDGRTVSYTRRDDGAIVEAKSHAGSLEYRWDGTLLTSVVDADGVAAFTNVYDDTGRVLQQTSPFGRVTTYRYDPSGQTVITDGAGVHQAMIHDRAGNLVAVVDSDGSAMRLTYDDAQRVVRVVERDGSEWRYEYDGRDDLVRRTDPDGLTHSWAWDDRHRLVAETDRAGTSHADGVRHRAPRPQPGDRSGRRGRQPGARRSWVAARDHRRRRRRHAVHVGSRRAAARHDRRVGWRHGVRLRRPRPPGPAHRADRGCHHPGARRRRTGAAHRTRRPRVDLHLHGGRADHGRHRTRRRRLVGDVRRPRGDGVDQRCHRGDGRVRSRPDRQRHDGHRSRRRRVHPRLRRGRPPRGDRRADRGHDHQGLRHPRPARHVHRRPRQRVAASARRVGPHGQLDSTRWRRHPVDVPSQRRDRHRHRARRANLDLRDRRRRASDRCRRPGRATGAGRLHAGRADPPTTLAGRAHRDLRLRRRRTAVRGRRDRRGPPHARPQPARLRRRRRRPGAPDRPRMGRRLPPDRRHHRRRHGVDRPRCRRSGDRDDRRHRGHGAVLVGPPWTDRRGRRPRRFGHRRTTTTSAAGSPARTHPAIGRSTSSTRSTAASPR